MSSLPEPRPKRILDFDIETLAAGYADPAWVPDIVTAWAASWIGRDGIECRVLPVRYLFDKKERARFLVPLLELLEEADVLTGHNIVRFDLRVLVAEAMRLGLPVPAATMVQDTMRIPKGKGFKKGQDNLAVLLDTQRKKQLNWQEWQDAYGEPDLATVRDRVVSDVEQHKQIRAEYMTRGWLKPAARWSP